MDQDFIITGNKLSILKNFAPTQFEQHVDAYFEKYDADLLHDSFKLFNKMAREKAQDESLRKTAFSTIIVGFGLVLLFVIMKLI